MKVGTYGQMGVGIGFCILLGLLWFVIPSYLFIVKKCNFLCDSALAPAVQKSLSRCVEEYCINKPFAAVSFEEIKRQFPMVAQIDAKYKVEGFLQCRLKLLQPRMIINDHFVFMEDDSVQNAVNFSEESLSTVPRLHMVQEDIVKLSRECKECFRNLSVALFDMFSIHWVNHTEVYLQDRRNPNIFMRADCYSALEDTLLGKYEKVKSEIVRQRFYTKKRWVVDVRFKNQIVVAQKSVEGL